MKLAANIHIMHISVRDGKKMCSLCARNGPHAAVISGKMNINYPCCIRPSPCITRSLRLSNSHWKLERARLVKLQMTQHISVAGIAIEPIRLNYARVSIGKARFKHEMPVRVGVVACEGTTGDGHGRRHCYSMHSHTRAACLLFGSLRR